MTFGVRPALAMGSVTLVINTVLLSILSDPGALAIVEHGVTPAAVVTLVGGA